MLVLDTDASKGQVITSHQKDEAEGLRDDGGHNTELEDGPNSHVEPLHQPSAQERRSPSCWDGHQTCSTSTDDDKAVTDDNTIMTAMMMMVVVVTTTMTMIDDDDDGDTCGDNRDDINENDDDNDDKGDGDS